MRRNLSAAVRSLTAAATVAALSGCGVQMAGVGWGLNPLTPEQSKTQVIDAAREIVSALRLPVVRAAFWHGSCNDQGEAPFRGEMRISYPPAASFRESDTEIAAMIARLTGAGWSDDPQFRSHSPVLTKDNVRVVFQRQNASVPTRGIEVLGECRDVTTTSRSGQRAQWVTLR